jgi:hypothetical protein
MLWRKALNLRCGVARDHEPERDTRGCAAGIGGAGGPAGDQRQDQCGLLDRVMDRVAARELLLTREDGFLPEMVGQGGAGAWLDDQADRVSGHLGYKKGHTEGRSSPDVVISVAMSGRTVGCTLATAASGVLQ